MAAIDKEIMIKAPPGKIFDFIVKSSNFTRLWPSLVAVTNEKLLPNGGYTNNWKYKMAGIYLKGKAECIELERNKRLLVKIKGAANCTLTWTLESEDNIQTKVTATLDYQVFWPLIKRLAEQIIIRMNNREAELVITNLKMILEES